MMLNTLYHTALENGTYIWAVDGPRPHQRQVVQTWEGRIKMNVQHRISLAIGVLIVNFSHFLQKLFHHEGHEVHEEIITAYIQFLSLCPS